MSIPEVSEVVKISKSNNKPEFKYFVVTEDYNFWTNAKYEIGEQVKFSNARYSDCN